MHIDIIQRIPILVLLQFITTQTELLESKLTVFDLWSKFKLVKLDFSIDDIGERSTIKEQMQIGKL